MQIIAFLDLIDSVDKRVAELPNQASIYTLRGIVASSHAGIKAGVGALKWAKAAKPDLEKAIGLNGGALQ